jgi:hypothetical protein
MPWRANSGEPVKMAIRLRGDILRHMSLRDELSVELANYKNDSETAIQEIATRGAISAIPYAGSAILEILNGLAQRRTQERLNTLFDAVKSRLDSLSEEKIDQEFFSSEEFQSLLFLLLEKLHTTHDKERLRMFGSALANSGRHEFKEDDKEQYIRVLRDLSLTDLNILNDEKLKGWTPYVQKIDYAPEVMVSLARLRGIGLVAEVPQREDSGAIKPPPKGNLGLSVFGYKFLNFVSNQARPDELNW